MSFYALLDTVDNIVAASPTVEEMAKYLKDLLPKVGVSAEIVRLQLRMYQGLGCGNKARLDVSRDTVTQFAARYGYPMAAIQHVVGFTEPEAKAGAASGTTGG